MASLIRPAVIWVLALVMPFQVLTAVYLDVLGPAHFHVDRDNHDHDHDHPHGHTHAHGAGHVERHHHHPHDPSVVSAHADGSLEALAPKEESASGWSGTMLVALIADGAPPHLPAMQSGLAPQPESLLKSRFPGRLERPPRTSLV